MPGITDTITSRRNFMAGGAAGFAFAALPLQSALAAAETKRTAKSGSASDLLKASDTQLLFAHCQEYLVATSKTTPPATIRKASAGLAALAQALSMPITFAFVPDNEGKASPISQLQGYLTDSNQYLRLAASPFLDKAFAAHMEQHQRKNLIIAGHASEVVIQRTAYDARRAGYDVYIPVDAVGSMSERTEQAAFGLITSAGGVLTSAWSLVAALAPDFSEGEGRKAFRAAQQF